MEEPHVYYHGELSLHTSIRPRRELAHVLSGMMALIQITKRPDQPTVSTALPQLSQD
jgi:hypothetical protein